jgi:hypothetical protein
MNTVKSLLVFAAIFACGKPAAEKQTEPEANELRDQEATASQPSANEDDYLISQSGVGRIRLGMTLAEAQRALASATFVRATDGDGAALVEVTLAPGQSLMLSADEDDADAAIDWAKSVTVIETFSRAFHTAEGVRPGTPVARVETVYGMTRQIELSEIESRQYIVFARQPEYLALRLDYTGIFRDGVRTTTEFEPDAKIMSIAVSSH